MKSEGPVPGHRSNPGTSPSSGASSPSRANPPPSGTGTRRFTRYTGTLLTPGPETGAWIACIVTALAFAAVVEWLGLVAPLPMGGDPGTWTALSYPFIGYPHPSEIVPFGYPPLLFPLLGFLVQLGGGPLVGARLFVGLVIVLLGITTYVLGRSLFRYRVSAILAEALLFATVPFDRLFFFGGYPTLLALVFFNLALAFGVRYIRGHRPAHAVYFWLATAATLLTHEFVGLALVVTLGVVTFFLLIKRQFPRGLLTSPAGAISAAFAFVAIGGFYLGARLAHVPQNNYLSSNSLSHGRTSISSVLYPLRLPQLAGLVSHGFEKYVCNPTGCHYALTPEGSFLIAVATVAVLGGVMLAVAIWRPRYLTPAWTVVGACVLAVLLMAVGGWVLNIYTDYRRFAYALYLPYILAGLLAYDTVFHWCAAPPSRPVDGTTASTPGRPRSSSRPQRSSSGRTRAPTLSAAVAVCGVAIVMVTGGVYTYPALVGFQQQYTGPLHSWAYVNAMESITSSGVPGSVLSLSGGATEHWTFAMTDRNVYSPTIVSGFIFKQARIQDDQLSFFPFNYWLATSNGLEFVAVPGNTSQFFYASPLLGALRFGTPSSIFEFPPDAFAVTLPNGTVVPAYTPGGSLPAFSVTPGTVPSLVIRYTTAYYAMTVTSTASPDGITYVNTTATQTGPVGLEDLTTGIRQVEGRTIPPKIDLPGGNQFVWNVGYTAYRSLTTEGSVAPPGTVSSANPNEKVGGAVSLRFDASSSSLTNGSPSLSLSVQFEVPGAISLGSALPAVLSGTSILQNWNVRFVVLNNITRLPERVIENYMEIEYGATPYFQQGQWEVLLLPATIP